jgi:hypothetical protein
MKYDFQMLFLMIGIGLVSKKPGWRTWFFIALFVGAWILFNWWKG